MKKKISFSLPYIDKKVVDEVNDVFKNTGWLTTGPKVRKFEDDIKKYTNAKAVLCVNSDVWCNVSSSLVWYTT